jgi:hypothetical protein
MLNGVSLVIYDPPSAGDLVPVVLLIRWTHPVLPPIVGFSPILPTLLAADLRRSTA